MRTKWRFIIWEGLPFRGMDGDPKEIVMLGRHWNSGSNGSIYINISPGIRRNAELGTLIIYDPLTDNYFNDLQYLPTI